MADDENTAANQLTWLLKVLLLPTGSLPLPESAENMLQPIDDDGSDDNRLVTLEVAIMAQVLLANHLRYRMLPNFFYNWMSNSITAYEQMIQGYGTAANVILETPYLVQKLAQWLEWIVEPIIPQLPQLAKVFVELNTAFRVWLDIMVVVNRERLATIAARDINQLGAAAMKDLKRSAMKYEPTGRRHRKVVSSRK